MPDESTRTKVTAVLEKINRAWLERRPADLSRYFHPVLTMVFPGFSGRAEGREASIAGFTDFCTNAIIHEYKENDLQIDVIGSTAIANYTYVTVYERAGKRSRATGRDLWVFSVHDGVWLAVWRTMLDLAEQPV